MNKFMKDSYNEKGDQITFANEQTDAINFVLERLPKPCILGLQAGYGKTLISLAIARRIMDFAPKLVTFIVCPKAATLAYKKDAPKLNINLSVFITGETRLVKNSRYFLFNYNTASKYMTPILTRLRESGYKVMLIADEVHSLKNPGTAITKYFYSVRKHICYILALSATPLMNHIEELFHVINFVYPGYLENYNKFSSQFLSIVKKKRTVKGRTYQYNEIVGYKNLDVLKEIVSKIILIKRKHYNLVFYLRACDLTDNERELYKRGAEGIFQNPETDPDLTIASRLHDLQRLADGTLEGYESGDMSKLKLLLQVLHEILVVKNEGVLVYTE